MGRVEELCPNTQGIIREAVVRFPSRRRIRRHVNIVIPFELEGTTSNETEFYEDLRNIQSTSSRSSLHHNLRQRYPTTAASISTITSFICCLLANTGLIAEASDAHIMKIIAKVSNVYSRYLKKGNIKYFSRAPLLENELPWKSSTSQWRARKGKNPISKIRLLVLRKVQTENLTV